MSNTQNLEKADVQPPVFSEEEIRAWLVAYLQKLLKKRGGVDNDRRFPDMGLDSMMLIVLTEELSVWMWRKIDPLVAYDHPSINKLARYLATQS